MTRAKRRTTGAGRLHTVFGIAVALLAVLFAAAPPDASAADSGDVGVTPVRLPGTPDRQYFFLEAGSGTGIRDAVEISNHSQTARTLRLYAADAYHTADGSFALRTAAEPARDVAAWVRLASSTVTLPPGGKANVEFTVDVPPGTSAGDHIGAVIAEDAEPSAVPKDGSGLAVKYRIGARIYLRVPGPAAPALELRDVRVHHDAPPFALPGHTGRVEVTFTVVNRGRLILTPSASLRAEGIFGRALQRDPRSLGRQLFPGESMTVTETWDGPPFADLLELRVHVDDPATGVAAARTVDLRIIPWPALGTAAVVLCGLLVGWERRRARRRLAVCTDPANEEAFDELGGAPTEESGRPVGAARTTRERT
ncbi:WxL protein peptidoglycan domain-containing protein [Yinghuangia soli]|uniref:DUF916 domain-containing protein n=1 Tax=Yinghuangia soli TaxID=2908204 RepID=A0AA41Q4R1_9ACTN|nr:DUF916 domain-containing protein [Yinghuangia soli]MCF2531535.1 DUF916 domain-containing protein [Yinghuangia soli]